MFIYTYVYMYIYMCVCVYIYIKFPSKKTELVIFLAGRETLYNTKGLLYKRI